MKRTMMFTAAGIFLLCLVSTARAQGYMDQIEDGKKVVAASQFLLSEANKLTSAKDADRAWMVDEGHLMIKNAYDYMETGEMMFSGDGRMNMQELGRKLLQSGQMLLKMGRQKGPVTQQEKDALKKEADVLAGFGKLMLEKGQIMAG